MNVVGLWFGEVDIVGHTVVGEVEVVGLCREFAGQCVNLLDHRHDAQLLTLCTDAQDLLFCLLGHLTLQQGAANLEVGEAFLLGFEQQLGRHILHLAVLLQFVVGIDDALEFLQEPLVDLGEVVYLVNGIAGLHGLADDEDALVGWFVQCLVDVGHLQNLVLQEAVHALSNHAQTLLDGLFEGAADGHDLTYRLHARTEFTVHTLELTEVPTRNLADDVVQCRLKEG